MKNVKKIILGCLLALMSIVACSCAMESEDTHEGQLKPPISSSSASGKNYEDIVLQFESAGFTNVSTREVPDLITGWLTKENHVDSISINGDTEYNANEWFSQDATVIVSYHTFAKKADASTSTDAKETNQSDSNDEKLSVEKSNEDSTEQDISSEALSAPESAFDALDKTTQNAYKAGIGYLDFTAFSKKGLIAQLSSEYADAYTVEQATAAVEAIEADGKVDWKAEAVEAAKSYLDFSSFSRSGLIDQLTSEYADQFTYEEAEYATDQVGLQ